MSIVDFLGTGVKFPFSMDNSIPESPRLARSSGEDSIRESILSILQTARGERVMRPDFGCGMHDFVFHPNSSTTARLIAAEIEEALLRFEPRIEVNSVNVTSGNAEGNLLEISIDYTIRAFNSKANIVFPFYLETR